MKHKHINWTRLKKKNYNLWRGILGKQTLAMLKSSSMLELSQLNEIGCFHGIPKKETFEIMKQEYEKEKGIPETWISKGNWPGIWVALFDPENVASYSSRLSHIIRFYFKDKFYLYDIYSKKHQKVWEDEKGIDDSDPWSKLLNEEGLSLEERMKRLSFPYHKNFYQQNKFGAVIGYSDYISVVITLPESVEKVEFIYRGLA